MSAGADPLAEVVAGAAGMAAAAVGLDLAVVVFVAILMAAAAVVVTKAGVDATVHPCGTDARNTAASGQVAQHADAMVMAMPVVTERMRTYRNRSVRMRMPEIPASMREDARTAVPVPVPLAVPAKSVMDPVPPAVMHVPATPPTSPAVYVPPATVASPVIVHAVIAVVPGGRPMLPLSLDAPSAATAATVMTAPASMLRHRRCGDQASEP